MRRALMLAGMLAMPGLVLGQAPPQSSEKEKSKQEARASEPASAPAENSAAKPAPKKGHPLDPADVAVLTGKDRPSGTNYRYGGSPYVYADFPSGGSVFTGGSTATRPLISPLFLHRGGRTDVLLFTDLPVVPRRSFFFLSGTRGRGVAAGPGFVVVR
jgi:hypothetical protein